MFDSDHDDNFSRIVGNIPFNPINDFIVRGFTLVRSWDEGVLLSAVGLLAFLGW